MDATFRLKKRSALIHAWAKLPPALERLRSTGRWQADYPEPLLRLSAGDWLFVGFVWFVIFWAVFITFDNFAPNSTIGFDYLPVAAGIPVVLVGWRALRVKVRVDEAVRELSGGAGLDVTGDIERFRAELGRRVRLWSLGSGAAITLAFATYFAWAITTGLLEVGTTATEISLFALMVIVCLSAGFVVGFLLGRLLGYGKVLSVMRDTGVAIARIETPQARSAIRRMEDVLRYAFIATIVMCHWFSIWFGFWLLGFDDGRDYRANFWVLFIMLWTVSFGFYLFAARGPTVAFQRRLEEIRGGPEAQQARERQLDEARDDLKRLQTAQMDERHRRAEEHELQAFIQEFEARGALSHLPRRWILDLLGVWIAVLLVSSFALSIWNGIRAGGGSP
jgi:hypothetical protein